MIYIPLFVLLGLSFTKIAVPKILETGYGVFLAAAILLLPFTYFPITTIVTPGLPGFTFRPAYPDSGWVFLLLCGLILAASCYGAAAKDKAAAANAA